MITTLTSINGLSIVSIPDADLARLQRTEEALAQIKAALASISDPLKASSKSAKDASAPSDKSDSPKLPPRRNPAPRSKAPRPKRHSAMKGEIRTSGNVLPVLRAMANFKEPCTTALVITSAKALGLKLSEKQVWSVVNCRPDLFAKSVIRGHYLLTDKGRAEAQRLSPSPSAPSDKSHKSPPSPMAAPAAQRADSPAPGTCAFCGHKAAGPGQKFCSESCANQSSAYHDHLKANGEKDA